MGAGVGAAKPPVTDTDTEGESSSSEEDEGTAAATTRPTEQGLLERQRGLQALAARFCGSRDEGMRLVETVCQAAASPDVEARAAAALAALEEAYPQFAMGGFRNIWVVKPSAMSRGRGIFCSNRWEGVEFYVPAH